MNSRMMNVLALILVPVLAQAQEGPVSKDKEVMRKFAQAVGDYVEQKSAQSSDGKFHTKDDVLGKSWRLDLVRVHKDRVAQLGSNKFFACADFKGKLAGKGADTDVDLDFYVTRRDGDDWHVDKIYVHKVSGEPRFTYNERNEMVGGPAPAARQAKTRPEFHKVDFPGSSQQQPPAGYPGAAAGAAGGAPQMPAGMPQLPPGVQLPAGVQMPNMQQQQPQGGMEHPKGQEHPH